MAERQLLCQLLPNNQPTPNTRPKIVTDHLRQEHVIWSEDADHLRQEHLIWSEDEDHLRQRNIEDDLQCVLQDMCFLRISLILKFTNRVLNVEDVV